MCHRQNGKQNSKLNYIANKFMSDHYITPSPECGAF